MVAVTGEANYTAVWKAKAAFATATWAEIADIIANDPRETFFVGDRKTITHTYANGTTEDVEIEVQKVNASNMVIGLVGVLTGYGSISFMEYGNTTMQTAQNYMATMLVRHMEDVFLTLPEDMQPLVYSTMQTVYDTSSKTNTVGTAKLWPFSATEVNAVSGREGSVFEPYKDTTRKKKGYAYWTRSMLTNRRIYYVKADGTAATTDSTSTQAYISYFCNIKKPS